MTTFAEGRERNIALGVWGAVGGFGAAAGVLLGGVLTDRSRWEWIFFVNIPVGVAALVLAPVLLRESRDTRVKTFDVLGAVLVTGGLVVLVLAITQGHSGAGARAGRSACSPPRRPARRLRRLGERAEEPLMPFSIFRTKTVLGANIAGFILGTVLFSMFLMLTLYMQQVLGYSAMKTGFAYLAVAGTAIIWANVAAALVNRVGVRPLIAAGMAMLSVGLLYFTQVSVDGSYVVGSAPRLPDHRARDGVLLRADHDRGAGRGQPGGGGLASGLINTSQQIGGALGIALLSTIAVSRTDDELAAGTALPQALTSGFQLAFWVGAAIALAGVVAALVLIRQEELAPAGADEAQPALEAALGALAGAKARSRLRPGRRELPTKAYVVRSWW